MADPVGMRHAVAGYVSEIHRTYLAQADTFAPAVRGAMPLLAAGTFRVAAVAARSLHLLATTESLGPLRGQEVELPGELDGLSWTVRFFDPVVLPELGLIDESAGPAITEVRRALGVSTVLYHLTAGAGSTFSPHNAAHVGTGLASGHTAAARDFEAIRQRARGREELVDELAGAWVAGLTRAQALLAAAIAPRDETLRQLAGQVRPDPDRVRRALLASVGGRAQWSPAQSGAKPQATRPDATQPESPRRSLIAEDTTGPSTPDPPRSRNLPGGLQRGADLPGGLQH